MSFGYAHASWAKTWGAFWATRILLVALLLLVSVQANAHLMPAQRGTLNIVGNDVFMVMSLPVSAFEGVDDDGDSKLSPAEFRIHRLAIAEAIKSGVSLSDPTGLRPLHGLMISPGHVDNPTDALFSELIVMGRYHLPGGVGSARFALDLFGQEPLERSFQVMVSNRAEGVSRLLVLSPENAFLALTPSTWAVFTDFALIGADHILVGADHLLFLLVVLAAGWGWRLLVLALTTFTVGHAITLTLSTFGMFSIPAAIVEPSIAATIVFIAAYDYVGGRGKRKWPVSGRMALVFVCALIHGLGLASALLATGLSDRQLLPGLAGFNVGIELAQLAVAALWMVLASVIQRWQGVAGRHVMTRIASVFALAFGCLWFVERIIKVV